MESHQSCHPGDGNRAKPAFALKLRADRRSATRLANGVTALCHTCGGLVEFRETYRVVRRARGTIEPAWICQNNRCGAREFVRS